jgi:hypothetical protein
MPTKKMFLREVRTHAPQVHSFCIARDASVISSENQNRNRRYGGFQQAFNIYWRKEGMNRAQGVIARCND